MKHTPALGRTPKGTGNSPVIAVRLAPAERQRLTAAAVAEGRSTSSFSRVLILKALAAHERKNPKSK